MRSWVFWEREWRKNKSYVCIGIEGKYNQVWEDWVRAGELSKVEPLWYELILVELFMYMDLRDFEEVVLVR